MPINLFGKKQTKQIYYFDILDENEVALIGEEIHAFEKGKIGYDVLKMRMSALGFPLSIQTRDFSTKKMTIEDAKTFKERLAKEEYIPSDIKYYNTITRDGISIYIYYDRRMMEVLAAHGNEEALETVTRLKRWEDAHRPPQRKK